MESLVKRDLERLADSLNDLLAQKGVEVFHLEEEMWLRTTELSHLGLQLQPFDQAILASILVKSEMLKKQGVNRFAFCEAIPTFSPGTRLERQRSHWRGYMMTLGFGCTEIF